MIAKEFDLIQRCIEDGVGYGYNRAFKHTDTPTPEQIKDCISMAVIQEICEWFEFPPYEEN